jgi:hypothetical protein
MEMGEQRLSDNLTELRKLPSAVWKARRRLPNVTAVYFVHGESGYIFYVGATKNLCNRFREVPHPGRLSDIKNLRISWIQ